MYGIDKVIEELKGRAGDKLNIDWIEDMLKAHKASTPDTVEVVEIEAAPIAEEEDGEAKPTELPTADEIEVCPKCGKNPCECEELNDEAPFEDSSEEKDAIEGDTELEAPSEEEKSRMDEILNAIKTFFPNENTEDVLVRVVSKLIDR